MSANNGDGDWPRDLAAISCASACADLTLEALFEGGDGSGWGEAGDLGEEADGGSNWPEVKAALPLGLASSSAMLLFMVSDGLKTKKVVDGD
ncbi:hypothetical protein MRB53_029829 [Persea americana]|uniref:Uncharacterized protein n=1 Tax=Persea americana TaxID=3435 RepID=A0ACC2KJH2_PERAE|nr:hypothetical protein MRB53_029829 [Persea americana]